MYVHFRQSPYISPILRLLPCAFLSYIICVTELTFHLKQKKNKNQKQIMKISSLFQG